MNRTIVEDLPIKEQAQLFHLHWRLWPGDRVWYPGPGGEPVLATVKYVPRVLTDTAIVKVELDCDPLKSVDAMYAELEILVQ
jgi:hypothetical protein